MSNKEITRFFVSEAGLIEVLDFKKRTFKQALKPFLKKGWKNDPCKLAAAMHKSSDLRDAVMVIRNAYLDHFEKLSDDLLQKISQEPTAAPKDDAASKKADKLLEEAYQDMLAATVLLSDIATKSLTNWVRTLSSHDYADLVEELRFFLIHEVTDTFNVWDASVDTPDGQAVTLLLDLAPDDFDEFEFELAESRQPGVPVRISTSKPVEELNAIAQKLELDIEFRSSRADSKSESNPAAASPAKPRKKAVKPAAVKKAEQKRASQKSSGRKSAAGKKLEKEAPKAK